MKVLDYLMKFSGVQRVFLTEDFTKPFIELAASKFRILESELWNSNKDEGFSVLLVSKPDKRDALNWSRLIRSAYKALITYE